MVSSFGITVLESRKSKEIDLYSNYTKNKLQALTLAAITSIWISLQSWDLAYSVHHGLVDQPRYSLALQSIAHRHMKAVLLKKWQKNVYCIINKRM